MKNNPSPSFICHPLMWLMGLAFLPGCSSESRDNIWRKVDPAGYKHAHSEVFNPGKYKHATPADSSEAPPEKEWDLTRPE